MSTVQTHLTSQIKPRPELMPTRVGIYIKTLSQIGGQQAVAIGEDIYPAGAPSGLRSFDTCLDMSGPRIALVTAQLTAYAFDPTATGFWTTHHPALNSATHPEMVPDSLALVNPAINDGSLNCITVLDSTGAAVDLTTYPNVMGHQGTNHPWTGVKTVEAFISCHLTYQRRKQLSSGVWVNFDHPNSQDLTVKVKLTNAPVGTTTYELEQLLSTGEVYPVGLAEAIYGSLTALQYQFNHTILEQPFTTIIKPGKHALNVSGGATAWATMNAMVQEVTIDLLCSPSAGLTVAKTQVRCGPVEHLEPGQLVQLTNLFCNRDLSKINPNERTSGLANGGQNAAMPSDTAKENSTQITPDAAQQMFSAPDMVISTNTNGLLTDPANGQIVLNHYQNTSSTPVAMGYLPPQYRGAGAPSTTTLAANVQYCQYSRYLDTSANAEWVCTTAGTNSTSAWAQLSGGGGGMNFRGYWVSTTNYALSDVVVLQSGVSAGLYISLIAANSNNPATGTGWMQLAPGNLVGSWT